MDADYFSLFFSSLTCYGTMKGDTFMYGVHNCWGFLFPLCSESLFVQTSSVDVQFALKLGNSDKNGDGVKTGKIDIG